MIVIYDRYCMFILTDDATFDDIMPYSGEIKPLFTSFTSNHITDGDDFT